MRSRLSSLLVTLFVSSAALVLWRSSLYRNDVELAGGTERVRVQLQWFDQAQFIGLYVAAHEGFFKREGLDVQITPGGYQTNPVLQVRNGQADIGLATGDRVLIEAAERADMKAIGTVFNRSLAAFMSKRSARISSPRDLRGKKVGVYVGFDTENILHSLLRKHNVPENSLTIVPAASVQAFINGELDAFPVYVINEPLSMQDQGIEVNLMRPEDYGIEYYSDTYFTTERYWRAHRPALVKFMRAAARGWEFAEQRPDQALAIMYEVARNVPRSEAPHQKAMLMVALQYLRAGEKKQLFYMSRDRWEAMEASLHDIGRIKTTGNVSSLCDFDLVSEALR
jgi:NitT/TauT family transport system substrate-binding protein